MGLSLLLSCIKHWTSILRACRKIYQKEMWCSLSFIISVTVVSCLPSKGNGWQNLTDFTHLEAAVGWCQKRDRRMLFSIHSTKADLSLSHWWSGDEMKVTPWNQEEKMLLSRYDGAMFKCKGRFGSMSVVFIIIWINSQRNKVLVLVWDSKIWKYILAFFSLLSFKCHYNS